MTDKVFEGIKIVEFAWVAVGPQTSKYLADHGATVVRVESHTHFDLFRGTSPFPQNKPGIDRSMFYGKYNADKYHATLNLNHPTGRDIALRFIQWADILTESFRPGTMNRWQLDYATVSKIKPKLIYFSTSMQGQTGPSKNYAGVGSLIAALSGFGEISGWPDRMPSPPYGAYSDYFCQRFAATMLIAALERRRRTGKGMWIEQSQLETSVYFNAPLVMDYAANGRVATRNGNRLPNAAPHGVYPCAGDDRWVAIAVLSEEQWTAFCGVTGMNAYQVEFKTLSDRKQNEDKLDELVCRWTAGRDAFEIERLMQTAGVPCNAVEKNADLLEDEQLKQRNFYVRLNHPQIGEAAFQQQADFILSKTPREVSRPSPCMGEHNEYVYKELLGMTDDELAECIASGCITTELPPAARFSANL
ncbi:CaiB/BaiF CoA transferase family protein [Chloroflexota bacterium]